MIIQSMSEYAGDYQSHIYSRGRELQIALDLIHDHRAIVLGSRTVHHLKLSLELLIQALLVYSRKNRFIKYYAWDKTIEIKGFKKSLLVYQYNPFREPGKRHANGQKPSIDPHKKTDFLDWETFPENEHYLIWTASSGRQYGIMAQPAPIVPDHLIIASLDLNPKNEKHFDQSMRYFQMTDMHELQMELFGLGYAMGYNDRGAGASVDHFHMQAVPRVFLPMTHAWQTGQIECAGSFSDPRGVSLKVLKTSGTGHKMSEGYPVNAVLLEADRYKTLLTKKRAILKRLQEHQITFNTISWQQPNGRYTEVFFPRKEEAVMNHAIKAGYVEMSGMLVMPSKELYQSITKPSQGLKGMMNAGLDDDSFQKFLKDIYHYFH